ncbi:MAG: hypothetical protein KBT21_04600 [Treponema sp.]|nr:hypothetical protein [Candidatus Treponema merdequi]
MEFSALADSTLNAHDEKAVNDVMQFRLTLLSLDSSTACSKIETYKKTALSDTELSEQAYLTIETFLILEQFNYIYEADQKDERLKDLILPQVKKLDAFIESNESSGINKWLYTIAGDTISCSMGFMPVAEAMKRGLVIKTYYLKAIEQDSSFSYALMNAGQWFFQAPAIGGGSKTKAREYFERAVRSAKTPAEIFYSNAFLSQSRFDDGNKSAAAELLQKAENVSPESFLVDKMKKVNQLGYHYFYYIMHRKEIDKKIK